MAPFKTLRRPRRDPLALVSILGAGLASASALILAASPVGAAELREATRLAGRGQYDEALAQAREAVADGEGGVGWRVLLVRTLMATGQRKEALAEAGALLDRHPNSLRALAAAHEVLRRNGQVTRADELLRRAQELLVAPGGAVASAEDLVAAGQLTLAAGGEPKSVLSTYFDAALRKDPACRDAFLAGGALALAKHDDAEAALWFQRGLKKLGADADLHTGLARTFLNGDRAELLKAVDAALQLNPRHTDALLLRAEHDVDAEDYAGSRRALERILALDPVEPRAWALHAVLAHLTGDPKAETRARDKALTVWAQNPEVDALIGRKLSEKYRFNEGAAYQRRALALDARSLPARIQLAQDLLRLGPEHEKEGWALVEAVHAEDGYDVNAFNLVTLREHLTKLPPLKQGPFLVRMAPREASVYGDAVLALLTEARGAIDARYGFANPRPVTVEIYPDQSDFAVRTFGTPGGAGYLGVCFGNLVTMNSPAGNVGVQSNWKAVLWHEYTHVVTLGLSRNKMPRWLSEGISVWEERRHDPSWGRRLNAKFQKMLKGKELVPLGSLSRAFLDAKSGDHMMFAYFESALAVEFLVERYGFDSLKAILRDLGEGMEINAAIATRTAPLADVEKGFAAYARKVADEPIVDAEALLAQAEKRRAAGDVAGERKALDEALAAAPDQGPAFGRLMELAETTGDHALLERATRGFLAVNPMAAAGWRGLGRALEHRAATDRAAADGATAAYRKVLLLEPADPADVHLRLARLLRTRSPREARRHALDALAEAPRFREGHKLLLELQRGAAP